MGNNAVSEDLNKPKKMTGIIYYSYYSYYYS